MFYQFLLQRFGESGWLVAAMSIAGVLCGLVLWLVGARFSRGIVTLIAVSIGALVGLRLPAWFAVPLGAWATAVGGALLLGITGYALHRMWVRAGLAFLLALWSGILVWNTCSGRRHIPDRVAGMGIMNIGRRSGTVCRGDFRRVGPFVRAGSGLWRDCIGLLVFWRRCFTAFLAYQC
jgi:hypothetical protein